MMNGDAGILYVVATPIGNLSDLSERARQTLAEADLVLCEDTRQTARLLSAFGLSVPTRSFHAHNERKMQQWVIDRLCAGSSIALVSDAGTPLISDPGYPLVREARRRGLRVSPIPGPSAVIAALSVSGLPADRFSFEGFLPSQSGRRRNALEKLANEPRTLIFYESSHRIAACLKDMVDLLDPDREIVICREMTKLHETFFFGPLGAAREFVDSADDQKKGEFVIVVDGRRDADHEWEKACALLDRLGAVLPAKEASRIAAETFSVSRNRLYRRIAEASAKE